jgi:hypothetical protein
MMICRTVLILALIVNTALAQKLAPKTSVPDDAAQKTALAVVADVYRPDYEKAKTTPQKVELAKKLLSDGSATKDDAVGRFVLFRVARDIAAQQGDLATSLDAIAKIDREFEGDKLRMQLDAAKTAVKTAKAPKDQGALGLLLMPLIDDNIAADRYDDAKVLGSLAVDCARSARDSERIKQLAAKTNEVDEVAAEYEKVKDAAATLAAKPSDREANAAVGKFRCFAKGDWSRGIAMLALGGNEAFKAAALLELEEKPDPLRIGDAWWKIADGLEGTAKSRTQVHAAEWYRKAVPNLSGLTKSRVERLISLAPDAVVASEHKNEPLSLLDRDSLKGWKGVLGSADSWSVKNGILSIKTPGPFLRTKEVFRDFELHMEFSFPTECNSGVFLRGRYEVQLIDSAVRLGNGPVPPLNMCGSIVGQIAPARVVYLGPNKWNSLDVRLVDREVSVKMNGTVLIDSQTIKAPTALAIDEKESDPGPIVLQNYAKEPKSVGAKFRNITIRPIP